MVHPLGTLLSSPVVTGSALDTFGTHFSSLGIGGWQEFETISERDAIPIDSLSRIDATGLSSGRRRLGMSVYVHETDVIYQLKIPNWSTFTTDAQKVSALSNNLNWIELETGAADAVSKDHTQAGHGFVIGDVIKHNGTSYVKSRADASNVDEHLGIVSEVDGDDFRVTYMGYIDLSTIAGLSANTLYFVSPTTAGAITPYEPFNVGEESKPILITQDSDEGIVLNYRGLIITDFQANGGNGVRIQRLIQKTAHGFVVGDVLGHDGSDYLKAIATVASDQEAVGIVSDVVDADNYSITYGGYFDGLSSATDANSKAFSADTTYFLSPTVSGKLTPDEPTTIGQISKPMINTLGLDDALVLNYRGVEVFEEGSFDGITYIGLPEEGTTYDDGLYQDLDSSTTTVGTAHDRWNKLWKAVAPGQAPNLSDVSKTNIDVFSSAKLSFGTTKNDISYANVVAIGGNSAIDINQDYTISGTRLGITTGSEVSGVLNDNVVSTPAYDANAWDGGDDGTLEIELNGSVIDSLDLTSTSIAIASASGRLVVSELKNVTFTGGDELDLFPYRTGTYNIPASSFRTGFNYMRINHNKTSGTISTNYLEWVYDPDGSGISNFGSAFINNITMGGSKYISGVEYHTTGTINYNIVLSNIYRDTFGTASSISFPTRLNIGDATSINKSGAGVVNTIETNKNLPLLDVGASNPQNTNLTIISTHSINVNEILGSIGSLGKISTNCGVTHPIKTDFVGGTAESTGFLYSTINQTSDEEKEDFVGETYRLEDKDYADVGITHGSIGAGSHDWDEMQSLVGGDANHNTGLLVFNNLLLYPSSNYLSTQYGITNGDFSSVTNGAGGNPDYSTASGVRSFYRRFKSNNPITQSTLTVEILHTGVDSDFMVNGGTGGVPSGDQIKMEAIIRRSNGSIHGPFNPFGSTGNPEGVTNILIETIAGGTRVHCTLATTPRIGNNDIIVLSVRAAATWSNRISEIEITNI